MKYNAQGNGFKHSMMDNLVWKHKHKTPKKNKELRVYVV